MYIIKVKIHPVSDVTIEGWIASDCGRCDRIRDAKWFPEASAAYKFIEILKRKWECTRKQYKVDFELWEPDGNDLLNDLLEDEPDHDLFEEARRKAKIFDQAEAKTVELLEQCEKIGKHLELADDLITEIRHILEAVK